MSNFISLHNHTYFSLLNSLVSPQDLFLKAKELNQPGIGITDYSTLSGAWDSLKASKETGVKLIIGSEFYFLNSMEEKKSKLRQVVLLAKNVVGYQNLLALTKIGFENSVGITKRPLTIIDWKLLEKYRNGLICLTACGNGIVSQLLNVKKFEEAEATIQRLIELFGSNLGLEVQTHHLNRPTSFYSESINQVFTNTQIIRLAKKYDVKIIPTTNTHYLCKEDAETHDVMLAVGAMQPVYSNARLKYSVPDLYLKSTEDVKAFFARNYTQEFAEQICENTIQFADMCEDPIWIDPMYDSPGKKELPIFPIEQDKYYGDFKVWLEKQSDSIKKLDADKNYLRFRCEMALKLKTPIGKDKEYKDRLEEELDTLYYCGVSSYMLIVADIVNWAKTNGLSTSPGRGSCGGSLVAYLLGIHKADPIKYGLVFQRFHNKLKASYSDIDLDFAKGQRDKILQYLITKYGKENFAQITNIIFITPKVYVRDISRSCEFGGDRKTAVKIGTDIADIIPKRSVEGKEVRTYKEMVEKSPLYSMYVERYPLLEKYAAICGKPRALGVHASGIIVSQRPLHTIIPLRIDKDGIISTQFDKDRVEEAGLVKIDILGLETLDIIDETNRLIKKADKEVPTIDYDEYDKKTYDLITSGDTFGVFQFGTSAGTIDLCKKIKPKSIEDLAVITAIARPVTKAIRADFIKAREGKIKHKLLHPSLERAFKNTFGFQLYDESLLILAKDVAGWDLAEADKLRKLTKEKGKNPEKVEKWRQEFIEGAFKNGINKEITIKIWDDIVSKFGSYAFNLSHAIVYSMVSYHTAYLKAHFPIEFLLSNLMFEVRSASKISKENIDKIKQEIRAMKIRIHPPDINKSDMTYKLQSDKSLLTGLEALKFVGEDAIKEIVSKRPFTSFADFIARCDPKVLRSNTIQALAASGCFDMFNVPRKLLFLYCSDYKKKLQVWLKTHDKNTETFEYPWPVEKEWPVQELYALEKFYLGEAFICNKIDAYSNFFKHKSVLVKDIVNMDDRDYIKDMRAEVKSIHEFKVKKETSKYLGQDMIKATIEDELSEQITLTIFPDKWKEIKKRMKELKNERKFEPGLAIHFAGSVNIYEDNIGIIMDTLFDFQCSPPMPKDLKTKKLSTRKTQKNNDMGQVDLTNIDDTIVSLEDQLFIEGLIDLTKDDNGDDDEFEFPTN
jgi:DNA polymerase-3 subunit alpha